MRRLLIATLLGLAGLMGGLGCGPTLSGWIEVSQKILKKRVWPTKRVVARKLKHRLSVEEERPTRLRIRIWEERYCAARIFMVYRPIFRRQKDCGCGGSCSWTGARLGDVRVQKGAWRITCGQRPLARQRLVVRVPMTHVGDASGEEKRKQRRLALPKTTDSHGRVFVDLAPLFVGRTYLDLPDRVTLELTLGKRKIEHVVYLDRKKTSALARFLRPSPVKRTVLPGTKATFHHNFGSPGKSSTSRIRFACPQAVRIRLQATWKSIRAIHLRTGEGPALLRGEPVTLSCPAGGEVSLLLIRKPCCAASGTLSVTATSAPPPVPTTPPRPSTTRPRPR